MKKAKISNLTYKIIAVVLALLLWFYVYLSDNPITEQVFNVPLQPLQLGQGLVMVDSNVSVQIRVQGQKQVLERAELRDISAYINLSNLEAGEHDLKVYVTLPDSLQQVSVNPANVTVRLEPTQSKRVPVEFVIEKTLLRSDYIMLEPHLEPAEIIVFGPSAYLDEVGSAFVSLDLSEATESLVVSLPVQLRDNLGEVINRNLELEPQTVQVFVPVVGAQPERMLPVNVPILGAPAPGYLVSRLVTQPSVVRAFGDMQALLDLKTLETMAIDITDAKGNISRQTELVLPGGITVADNRNIQVEIMIEPALQKNIEKALIYHYNTPQDVMVEAQHQRVSLVVNGPESFIENLNEGDIIPYVDLQSLEEGEHALAVQVNLPANITLVSISPQVEQITIKGLED